MKARSLKWLAFFLLVAGIGLWWARQNPSWRVEPQEDLLILWFLIDTVSAQRLGMYGKSPSPSPFLDHLARESVVFERAYAPAPWTLPSVVSLHTGAPPCEHQVLLDGQKLGPDWETLAQRLKQAGFSTTSLYANPYAGPISGLDAGFDSSLYLPQFSDKVLNSWARQRGNGPWFVYAHSVGPHDPYAYLPQFQKHFGSVTEAQVDEFNRLLRRYRTLTRVDLDAGLPLGSTDNTPEQSAMLQSLLKHKERGEAIYHASMMASDNEMASAIQGLKAAGLWKKTLLLVTSDHGEELGEHGGWQHDQSLYDELIHVPFLLRFPDGRGAGRRISQPVALTDLMPGLLDLLGLEKSPTPNWFHLLEGRELPSPLVTSVRMNRKKFYRPFHNARGEVNVALFKENWKGIWNVEPQRLELFDLENDPGESQDQSASHPELARSLESFARDWFQTCQENAQQRGIAEQLPLDRESLERLQSLGYVDP